MRFWIESGSEILFHYIDDGDSEKCDVCIQKEISGKCHKDRYAHRLILDDNKYIFCHDKNTPGKQAKIISKVSASAYRDSRKFIAKRAADITAAELVATHNARKIVASMGQKIDRIFTEDEVIKTKDRVSLIEKKLKNNSKLSARELLNLRKSIDQIEAEYNFIDIVNKDKPFASKDLTPVGAHQLIVSAFYLYEDDFIENKINVVINVPNTRLRVNFGVAKSAISQILNNAIKYCYPKTDVFATLNETETHFEIVFDMTSLYFSSNEAAYLTRMSTRGLQTEGMPGSGIGLYAANLCVIMHSGYLKMISSENVKIRNNGKTYSQNKFVLGFKRHDK